MSSTHMPLNKKLYTIMFLAELFIVEKYWNNVMSIITRRRHKPWHSHKTKYNAAFTMTIATRVASTEQKELVEGYTSRHHLFKVLRSAKQCYVIFMAIWKFENKYNNMHKNYDTIYCWVISGKRGKQMDPKEQNETSTVSICLFKYLENILNEHNIMFKVW